MWGLDFLFSYLIFPGVIFATVLGLLFEGIDRKIAAHMQSRIGPPVWQPFFDLGKLLSKEDITPQRAQRWAFIGAPLIAFGAVITVMTMIPVNSAVAAFSSAADLLVIIYLLNIPAVALIIGGYASSSPFGVMGSGRYVVQLFAYEFAFIVAALTVVAQVGSLGLAEIVNYQASNSWLLFEMPLAFIAAVLVAPGKLLKTPFDIPEAETEIVSGPLTEYSGPKLGIFKTVFNIEILALVGFITALFLGGPVSHTIGGVYIPGIVSFLIKAVALLILVTLIRCVTARVRIHQALKFYWLPVVAIALINFIVVVVF